MIKKLFTSALLLASLSIFNASAEIVKKIEVNGNKRISEETIKIYGKIKLNENFIRNIVKFHR